MCGFCGILQERDPVDRTLLNKMRETMYHRGPDEGDSYFDGGLGLGFRRLKVIDLLTGGQPMSSEDGSLWLVCNGEIYNYAALREELQKKGHRFSTQSDCEVILHLYEEKGEQCLEPLRGMFAFVLWDSRKKVLFGARDRFGIKPFYYMVKPGIFAFASEIKALAELPSFSGAVDEGAFVDYLTFQYVPEPRTMFAGVYRLPPGHYFVKSAGKPLQVKRYWQVQFAPSSEPLPYFLEGIREKLRQSVRLHLASDVPRGAFLSGGVDSAIIAALARELQPLSTFSVGYEEESFSELHEARETACFLETDHHEYVINPAEFLQNLPRLAWHFDEPVADPAAISLFFVARMARKKVTVVLSGEGADEVFGGYGIYREPLSLAPLQLLPYPLKKGLGLVQKIIPPGIPGKNYLARAARPLEERFLGNAFIFSPGEKESIINREINPSPFRITETLYRQVEGLDEVTRMQYIDLHTWMPGDILVKADKMTMANSLELRVPYLDHVLFQFAAALPRKYKVTGGTTKKALREAFKHLLPPEVLNRPKKGFPVPTREWIKRKDFRRLFRELLAGDGGEWFNSGAVQKLLAAHVDGKKENSRKLWTVFIFLLWKDAFKRRPGA